YRVRRDLLDQQLARLGLDAARARILDVGCGTGGAALTLARHGRAVALDRSPESFRLAMDRPYTHRVVASAAAPLPFADGSFDVACALAILEHLDDDGAAARELHRVCKPGGHVIAYVPAYRLLWGYNDEYSHHKRRYRKSQLRRVIADAGFAVREAGYFNPALFLPTPAPPGPAPPCAAGRRGPPTAWSTRPARRRGTTFWRRCSAPSCRYCAAARCPLAPPPTASGCGSERARAGASARGPARSHRDAE